MLNTDVLMQNFILENNASFNKFDKKNFIKSAAFSLNKPTNLRANVDTMMYMNFLERTSDSISIIEVDTYAMIEFISKVLNSPKIEFNDLVMRDVQEDLITIKSQYLSEALKVYTQKLDYVILLITKGTDSDIIIKKLEIMNNISDEYGEVLKQRIVSGEFPKYMSLRDITDFNNREIVPVDKSYIQEYVIPFIKNIPQRKKELISEISILNSIISSINIDIKRIDKDIDFIADKYLADDNKHNRKIYNKLLQYKYNYTRALMEAMSFTVYAMIKKAHSFEVSVTSCQNIYNKIMMMFSDSVNLVESGAFDSRAISSTDTEDMLDDFLSGDNDIYAELSHNIMEYHQGYISSRCNIDTDIEGVQDVIADALNRYEYPKYIHDNIIKSYIEIGNSLDILAKNADDYLMIFDELIQKAGLAIPLEDRFKNYINALNDYTMYTLTNINIGNFGQKTDVYFKILSEINNYPESTLQIAKTAKDINTKIIVVEGLFYDKKNGEFAYSESMNELKIFIESFKEQYKSLTSLIVKGLYHRLKTLAIKADQCLDNVVGTDNISDQYSDDMFDNMLTESFMEELDYIDQYNDLVMEKLLTEYYIAREEIERGVHIIYEDENNTDSNGSTPQNSGNNGGSSGGNSDQNIKNGTNAQNKQSTKPTVVNDSEKDNANNNDSPLNIKSSIDRVIKNIIDAFTNFINRVKGKNKQWIIDNKNGLINRSYSNVSMKFLPYDKMPTQTILNDLEKFANNCKSMNKDRLSGIKTYEEMRSNLIPSSISFKDGVEDKVSIVNYYKVGNNNLEVVTYSNGDLKKQIVETIIPYCENFYDNFYNTVEGKLNEISNQIQVTESYIESLSELIVMMEADSNNDSGDKEKWFKTCVDNMCSGVLVSIRDRNSDYLKILQAMAPKKKTENTTKNDNQSKK